MSKDIQRLLRACGRLLECLMPSRSDDELELGDELQAVADLLREVVPADRVRETPPESLWHAIDAEVHRAEPASLQPLVAAAPREWRVFEADGPVSHPPRTDPSQSPGSVPEAARDTSDDSASDQGPHHEAVDVDALAAAHEATRAMVHAGSAAEISAVLVGAVERLGGTVGPAEVEGGDVLPVDLSLGHGEPLLPRADPLSVTRMRLEALLPALVEDARRMAALLGQRSDPT